MIGTPSDVQVAREHIERAGAGALAFSKSLLDEHDSIAIVEGDLVIDRLCEPYGSPLLVTGSLRARGPVIVDEGSPLIVLGDLHASDVYIWMAALYVGGSLAAPGLVYLHSGNDYSTLIGGDAHVGALYEGGMHTTICGRASGQLFRTMNQIRVGVTDLPMAGSDAMRSCFVPEVWADNLDGDQVFEYLVAGQSVLRR